MCVSFFYFDENPSAKYKLVFVNNRDEYLDRPTSRSKWENGILAGRDEKDLSRGTWLCMDKNGRVANLLSLTVPISSLKRSALSRGRIPLDFIYGNKSNEDFCESLVDCVEYFNPFQILCFEQDAKGQYGCCIFATELVDKIRPKKLSPGVYGIGNTPLDQPFKKVQRGINHMQKIVDEIKIGDDFFTRCFPDELLKKQCGTSNELCRYQSALFVQYPDGIRYGTRTHTIILVDRLNRVTFHEKTMIKAPKVISNAEWDERTFRFTLNPIY
ncbi:unnamed protein product [Dracunculus medinensis]|uniref:Transport and Golgi organization protein 2 homolog n=1 Tax=Dracunculus medinensis TaxID=318479 RepID=A0A0N4URK9_DRAME|nr:unnamed protein product [Dracunculus medinensis]